ncbi:MAG: FG-GAP-like repeat-containing protein [Chryseolinea sp.]
MRGTSPSTSGRIWMLIRHITVLAFVLCLCTSLYAQQPVVSKVEKISDYTQATVLISGSGFGASASSVQVWFDQVRGSIVSLKDNAITATVPPEARLHNVEVINTASHLSAKSSLKYMSSYSGEGFNTSKLAAPLIFSSTTSVFDLYSCDLNLDNKPELIGTKFESPSTDIIILQNQSTPGNLAFNTIDKTTLPALNLNAPTGHVVCGDLNGDGKPELVASRSGATANSLYVLENTSSGTVSFATRVELLLDAGHFARQVAIQDLNRDGKPEIIVANSFNSVLYVFVNQSTSGTLSISPTPVKITMSGVPNSLALEVQDMDNDGRADIVLTQNQGSSIYLLKNISTSTVAFSAPTIIPIPGSFNDLSSADFNGDGLLDLVATSVFNAQVLVLLNKSTSSVFTFAPAVTLTTGTGPFGSDVSDLNGDGFPDIVIPNRGVAAIDVFLHNGNLASPGFAKTTISTGKTNWFVRAGDLDGDAKPDIAYTSFTAPTSYSIEILRNKNCYQPKILNDAALTLCSGQSANLQAVPSPTASFNWLNNSVSFKNGTDNFAAVTLAGSYTVTATSEAGACALTSAPVVVSTSAATAPATPVITPVGPVCNGQPINFSTTAVAGASYMWTGPTNFSATETTNTLTIPSAGVSNTGTYALKLKVGSCVSDPGTVDVQVVSLGSFSVSSSASGPVCQGQSVTLSTTSGAGYGYQWVKDGGDISGATNNTLAVTQSGNYKVRVSFTTCNSETTELPVVILTAPVSGYSLQTSACIGENVPFTSTASVDSRATVNYQYAFGDATSSTSPNAAHSYTTAQTYVTSLTVSYQGVTGCTHSVSKSIAITTAEIPEILADVSEACPGDAVVLTLNNSYPSAVWSNGASGISISVDQPGNYSVNTTDANGCKGIDDIEIILKSDCGEVVVLIPNMFSPNGDTRNDRWVIPGLETHQNCTMSVFDDKGVRVFRQSEYPNDGWDGSFNGKPLPDGVYYYYLACPDSKPKTGSVTIVR